MILNELGVCNFYQTVRRDQFQTFAEKIAEVFPKDKLIPQRQVKAVRPPQHTL
jgi:hypothetical protein